MCSDSANDAEAPLASSPMLHAMAVACTLHPAGTPAMLMEPRSIQGRETTVFAAIFHVVEHFSTHTGQIVWIAKMCGAPGAIRFYDDANNAAPLFLEDGRGDVD